MSLCQHGNVLSHCAECNPAQGRSSSPSQKPKMFTVEQLAACLCVINGMSIIDSIDGSPNWWTFRETAEKMLSAVSEIAQTNAAAQAAMQPQQDGKPHWPASAAPSNDKRETPKPVPLSECLIIMRARLSEYLSPAEDRELATAADRLYELERELNAARSATGATDIPLCSGHAQAWFCERNHLAGDHDCVVCAFLGQKK